MKSTSYRQKKSTIFKEIDGVIYILDHRTNTIHTLNTTASFLWRQLATPHTLQELCTLVCNTFAVEKRAARQDIKEFLDLYRKRRFIVPT